ncbi:hypothetical protein WA026_004131 [Henosepilachna vigintioctopunctata]|uniref:Uncharacterized protein n=1 Tax=Henosepilachna vigintioctopunctata TaxID=420089 RepID=A0AAW1U6K9_9CUCU
MERCALAQRAEYVLCAAHGQLGYGLERQRWNLRRCVSAGQHLQLSGELKGNVSIATHQGLHFNQQHTSSNNASAQQPQSQSQGGGQQNQMPSHPQSQMGGNSTQNVQNPHGNINMSQQQSQSSMSNSMNNPMMSNAQQQQIPTAQHMGSQQGPMGNSMQNGGMQGMQGMGNPGMQSSIQGPGGNMQSGIQNSASMSGGSMQGSLGGMGGNNMMGGSPLHPGSMSSLSENYSMSQSQTINFTQQNLRQRGNGGPGMGTPMSGNPTMNPMSAQMGAARMMNQQQQAVLEQQQKLMQQQMLRNQQQQQHQQAAAAAAMQQHMVRPPPPEYKASAGMMQPRYGAGMRRMPHQPIPPSGPMMRPHNVYMLQQQQQQHLATRNIYPRQQNPMTSSIEALQQKTEWRHILLSQQQNTNFNNQMRPQFQQGFNMNPAANNIQQMTALQHQQMRMQHSLTPGGISSGGQPMGQAQVMNQGPGSGPMSQLGGMNQQMQLMQQQNLMQQQQNSQLSMTNIHMQQSQSLSLNQSLQQHQQQNNMNLVNNSSAATNSLASFNPQAADFNLEFLDNLSTSDSAPFSEQELLSSFDTDSGFNLDF